MTINKALLLALSISLSMLAQTAQAQKIKPKEVKRIISTLAADDLQGRMTFKPGIAQASTFLEGEFKKAGLQPLPGATGYRQEFNMNNVNTGEVKLNGATVAPEDVLVFSTQPQIDWSNTGNVTVETIGPDDDFRTKYRDAAVTGVKTPTLYWVDPKHGGTLKMIANRRKVVNAVADIATPAVFILKPADVPATWTLSIKQEVEKMPLNNVAGMIKGSTKPEEYVVFSGHYDHIGILKPGAEQDSIANGADDDASGTTAVVMLANYYKKKHPERSIIFVAFTAEEIGGFGSQYFSKQLDPNKVVAMFNIEMIGKESKFGRNSAFITGFERSDFGPILQRNLQGSAFRFHPDPYPEQNLFFRSDNATLARLGVPAHTISTTQIDKDKLYHSVDDEVESLDIQNITDIIKAIAKSAESIIAGKDTPTRITDVK